MNGMIQNLESSMEEENKIGWRERFANRVWSILGSEKVAKVCEKGIEKVVDRAVDAGIREFAGNNEESLEDRLRQLNVNSYFPQVPTHRPQITR